MFWHRKRLGRTNTASSHYILDFNGFVFLLKIQLKLFVYCWKNIDQEYLVSLVFRLFYNRPNEVACLWTQCCCAAIVGYQKGPKKLN